MSGWYDGRATITPPVKLQQSLVVLARYSGITKSSVEETKRIHPAATVPLIVVIDSGGVGLGILRMEKKKTKKNMNGTIQEKDEEGGGGDDMQTETE
jgi:hypothetical protein